ncbi:MAG: ATPase [Burkholderiales bacterium]|nr:ATPase [Burkholderiales bacterium]
MKSTDTPPAVSCLGLGIDAGGTQTRWALADISGKIIADGQVAGLTGLQMSTVSGRRHIHDVLTDLAAKVHVHGRPARIFAGLTGLGEGIETLRALLAGALGVTAHAVALGSDVEIAYRDIYALGEGYLVYAGTGSVAAFIDDADCLHRAGGHGVLLDDAGGGFWIAREALRLIWRNEDARPDSWRESSMACKIFARIGGSDWAHTREFVYGRASDDIRGEIGKLALAVAAAADDDPHARHILEAAGEELARLGRVLILRFGVRPVTLSGRVAKLHPLIAEAMQAALPDSTPFQIKTSDAHFAAAGIAARSVSVSVKNN